MFLQPPFSGIGRTRIVMLLVVEPIRDHRHRELHVLEERADVRALTEIIAPYVGIDGSFSERSVGNSRQEMEGHLTHYGVRRVRHENYPFLVLDGLFRLGDHTRFGTLDKLPALQIIL